MLGTTLLNGNQRVHPVTFFRIFAFHLTGAGELHRMLPLTLCSVFRNGFLPGRAFHMMMMAMMMNILQSLQQRISFFHRLTHRRCVKKYLLVACSQVNLCMWCLDIYRMRRIITTTMYKTRVRQCIPAPWLPAMIAPSSTTRTNRWRSTGYIFQRMARLINAQKWFKTFYKIRPETE